MQLLFSFVFIITSPALFSQSHLTISKPTGGSYYEPLEEVIIQSDKPGIIEVADAAGNTYFTSQVADKTTFKVGGTLGYQCLILKDKKQTVIDRYIIQVNCKTNIEDEGGYYNNLLNMLYFTMISDNAGGAYHYYRGKPYLTFAGWFQDHVHVFKAMKYYTDDIKSGIDLYALGQRDDGMIYDNFYQGVDTYKSWLTRFGPDFVTDPGDPKLNTSYFVRIPVENMSEFTFLEGVYYVWKATGDDEWMKGKLDNCIRAVEYSTSDPYRWSDKFQLLKRGYTIDIWDFQPEEDTKPWDGDIMMAKPGVTNYSVMYGDNVGMAVGCEYLTEMLRRANRPDDANRIQQIGEGIRKRTDALCWNGKFYTHHIPEDPTVKRDFGNTDTERQVTISNSYAINRRIGHDKAVALIKTYQRIAGEMPESSPGEWYLCYPPYEKGWHLQKWDYMNGGVSSIVAGEVAHGAFENGYENYGVHILKRMWEFSQQTDGRLYCIYKGAMPEMPVRNFTPVSLKNIANADLSGKGAENVPGWTGQGGNDLSAFPVGSQAFKDVPFSIVDPSQNGRKACLIMSGTKEYSQKSTLKIDQKARSVYILHAQSYGNYVGSMVLNYSDGTTSTKYIIRGENIGEWWYPRNTGSAQVAWRGKNEKCLDVGAYIYGFNNPQPEKTISSITFNSAEGNQKWMILGLTLSDYPVFFMPGIESYGAPDNWGAAAVIYALVEGLAGVKDLDIMYNRTLVAPRWTAAGVNNVSAVIKYEASGGYVSYRYNYKSDARTLDIMFTGNASDYEIKILLPENQSVKNLLVDGTAHEVRIEQVESSSYLAFNLKGIEVHEVKVTLE